MTDTSTALAAVVPKKSKRLGTIAAEHDLSRSTLYNEIKDGYLEVTKLRGCTIVTNEQEQRWLDTWASRQRSA